MTGFEQFFEVIVISEEVGIKKPDTRIFDVCLAGMGLSADACIHIGDHPVNDVAAAKAAGLRAVWMRNTHYDQPTEHDGVIECLGELAELLERLLTQA